MTNVPRDDIEAALHVRQEMGTEIEPALVDSLAAKIDAAVESRVRAERKLDKYPKPHNPGQLALAIASIALGIPLTAIAGSMAGLVGILITWVGIVIVNIAYGGLPGQGGRR